MVGSGRVVVLAALAGYRELPTGVAVGGFPAARGAGLAGDFERTLGALLGGPVDGRQSLFHRWPRLQYSITGPLGIGAFLPTRALCMVCTSTPNISKFGSGTQI